MAIRHVQAWGEIGDSAPESHTLQGYLTAGGRKRPQKAEIDGRVP
jgi:hypothetical protein